MYYYLALSRKPALRQKAAVSEESEAMKAREGGRERGSCGRATTRNLERRELFLSRWGAREGKGREGTDVSACCNFYLARRRLLHLAYIHTYGVYTTRAAKIKSQQMQPMDDHAATAAAGQTIPVSRAPCRPPALAAAPEARCRKPRSPS